MTELDESRTMAQNRDVERIMQTIPPAVVDGGHRIAVREAMLKAWNSGATWADWEPLGGEPRDEPSVASPSPSEAVAGVGRARSAASLTERRGERTVGGRGEGFWSTGEPETLARAEISADAWGELKGWWEQTAHDEVAGMIDKMAEYGGAHRATDLLAIGYDLAHMAGWEGVDDAVATELGIVFYLRGKMARVMAAVTEKRLPSADTWLDIGIYTRMVQRTRACGGWPT